MARTDSSNNKAGRTSDRSTHETIAASGSASAPGVATTTSITVLSGPGTITRCTRRSMGSPGR